MRSSDNEKRLNICVLCFFNVSHRTQPLTKFEFELSGLKSVVTLLSLCAVESLGFQMFATGFQ